MSWPRPIGRPRGRRWQPTSSTPAAILFLPTPSLPASRRLFSGCNCNEPRILPALPHAFLFFLQFGLKLAAVVDKLLAERFLLFKIFCGFGNLAVQRDFARRDFRRILGIDRKSAV